MKDEARDLCHSEVALYSSDWDWSVSASNRNQPRKFVGVISYFKGGERRDEIAASSLFRCCSRGPRCTGSLRPIFCFLYYLVWQALANCSIGIFLLTCKISSSVNLILKNFLIIWFSLTIYSFFIYPKKKKSFFINESLFN